MRSKNTLRKNFKKLIAGDLEDKIVMIIDHKDTSFIGLKGRILLETSKTIHIQTSRKLRIVSKENGQFRIKFKKNWFLVEGKLLVGVQSKRSKKKLRVW